MCKPSSAHQVRLVSRSHREVASVAPPSGEALRRDPLEEGWPVLRKDLEEPIPDHVALCIADAHHGRDAHIGWGSGGTSVLVGPGTAIGASGYYRS